MSTITPQRESGPRRVGTVRRASPPLCAAAGLLSVPAMWLPLPHLLLVVLAGAAGLAGMMTARDSRKPSRTTRMLCGVGLAAAAVSLAVSLASCTTNAF